VLSPLALLHPKSKQRQHEQKKKEISEEIHQLFFVQFLKVTNLMIFHQLFTHNDVE